MRVHASLPRLPNGSQSPLEFELLRLVPGYVSTEVDGNLSFNVAASVARAHQIIDAYKQRGVGLERVLIKLASTWEGSVSG